MAVCMVFSSCTEKLDPEELGGAEGQMVLFSAGNAENAVSKASIPFMEEGGRFVCRMYYRAQVGDTDSSDYDVEKPEDGGSRVTSWLKVNNTVGNSVYWNAEYTDVDPGLVNEYGEKAAQAFYWQNRLKHAFLAVADYSVLKTNKASVSLNMTDDYVKEVSTNDSSKHYYLKKYELNDGTIVTSYEDIVYTDGPHTEHGENDSLFGTEFMDTDGYYYVWSWWESKVIDENTTALYRALYRVTSEKVKIKYYAKTYDLTKGSRSSMAEQPDPIQALTIKKPDGATQEANRVNLYFKHQFSQIRVNLKKSSDENDIPVEAGDILSVELLGVSKKGYVYVELSADGTVHPTDAEPVNKNTCPEVTDWVANPYGTSFVMFDRTSSLTAAETDMGYIRSFEAIAFGSLEGIRIRWKETDDMGGTVHTVTYQIPDQTLKALQSGTRYIYNMEIRRGTLALVRTVIEDWAVDQTEYNASGTITTTNN